MMERSSEDFVNVERLGPEYDALRSTVLAIRPGGVKVDGNPGQTAKERDSICAALACQSVEASEPFSLRVQR